MSASTCGSVTTSIGGRYRLARATSAGTMVPGGANPHRVIHRLALLLAPLLLVGCAGAMADGPPDGFTKYACRAMQSLFVAASMNSGDTMGLAAQWALLWIDQAPVWEPGETYRAAVVAAVAGLNDAAYAGDPATAAAGALDAPQRALSDLGIDCGSVASPSPS